MKTLTEQLTLMGVLMGAALVFSAWAAQQSTPVWLTLGVGGFVVGWILQFIGHGKAASQPSSTTSPAL